MFLNINLCRSNLRDVRLLTEIAHQHRIATDYHLVERSYGSFSRTIRLPAAVNADKIEANYEKGVLTVTCPKKEPVKPKAITIKTAK